MNFKRFSITALQVIGLGLLPTAALANTTNTVTYSVTVPGNCTFTYANGEDETVTLSYDQGNERYQTEIHCTEFTFLTPKNESGADNSGNSQVSGNKTAKPKNDNYSNRNEAYSQDEEEDDLPF